jgi:hypothetical protein
MMVRVNIQRPLLPQVNDLKLGNRIWKVLTIHNRGFRIDRVRTIVMMGIS